MAPRSGQPHLRLATLEGATLPGLDQPRARPRQRRTRAPASAFTGLSSLIAGTAERLPSLFARYRRAVDEGDHIVLRALATEIDFEVRFLATQATNLHAALTRA